MVRLQASFLLLALGLSACSALGSHLEAADGEAPGVTDPTAGVLPPAGGAVGGGGNVPPFAALDATSGARKVKAVLTGAALTDDELRGFDGTQAGMKKLVASWMATPSYDATMRDFFSLQFQQSQMDDDFATVRLFSGLRPDDETIDNLRLSFALTAEDIVKSNRPFHETMTTNRFMMTTAMMSYYLYVDAVPVSDSGGGDCRWWRNNATFGPTWRANGGPISSDDSSNPNGPSYLTFYAPGLKASTLSVFSPHKPVNGEQTCRSADPLTQYDLRTFAYHNTWGPNLWSQTHGGGFLFIYPEAYRDDSLYCDVPGSGNSLWRASDYNDWRPVTVRPPATGERTPEFFDVNRLRRQNELPMAGERVGFFSTPAFLSQWGTNKDNSTRGAANQTLIAALGGQVDGSDILPLTSPSAVDARHASDPACFTCHQTLDPLRQYFRQALTLSYSTQADPNVMATPAQFSFHGHRADGRGLAGLGKALATHPQFAQAWVVKLCSWANSAACAQDDPEVVRIAKLFAESNFNFNEMALEVFSSPLVTYREATASARATGQVASVARRDQLCRLLEARLGLDDLCGNPWDPATNGTTTKARAAALTRDSYTRGQAQPLYVVAPDPFYWSNVENICSLTAASVVDGPVAWASSKSPEAAVAKMVAELMGVDKDRRAEPVAVLQQHVDAMVAGGAAPTVALRSAFVAACVSAATLGIGT